MSLKTFVDKNKKNIIIGVLACSLAANVGMLIATIVMSNKNKIPANSITVDGIDADMMKEIGSNPELTVISPCEPHGFKIDLDNGETVDPCAIIAIVSKSQK